MNNKVLREFNPHGKLYFNKEMGTIEAIIPQGRWITSQGPSLLELDNGDLLCTWSAGTLEGDLDSHIVLSRLNKGEDKWKDAINISRDPNRQEQYPSLFKGINGVLWCLYTAQLGRVPGKENMQFTSQIRLQKSFDNGKSWSEYETIFPEEGSKARQGIQVLKKGRWIYGNWICSGTREGLGGASSAFRISDDGGKSWKFVMIPESSGKVHPTVVELDGGQLVAFMKSTKSDYIYRSHSNDGGDTWTVPEASPLPNNNTAISAIKLQSGRIAIAYNPHRDKENLESTIEGHIAVALSEDGGIDFPIIRYFERGKKSMVKAHDYEYPYIIQGKDGRIHLVYSINSRSSIKYVSFTEDYLIDGLK